MITDNKRYLVHWAPIFVIPVMLVACSSSKNASEAGDAANSVTAVAPVPAATPAPGQTPAAAPAAVAGFDAERAPLANPTTGKWPYFSLIDGYEAMSVKNSPGDSAREYLRDAKFDEYEFFDGTKLIRVEGRLFTTRGNGENASFFEVKRTYQKLVQDLGGVTVFEGGGKAMKALKLEFADRRHRAYYVDYDEMGVYMLRAPDRQIWVEVYKPYNNKGGNYWLTVVEKQTLQARASVLPAEEMKRALDKDGRVALYVNFDTDRATIKPESAPLIAQIVKLLTDTPALKVAVDGHTDDTGDPARNMALSKARADAVVAALVAQGIVAGRLSARSFGQTKPLAPNDSEAGKASNRRVELVKL